MDCCRKTIIRQNGLAAKEPHLDGSVLDFEHLSCNLALRVELTDIHDLVNAQLGMNRLLGGALGHVILHFHQPIWHADSTRD